MRYKCLEKYKDEEKNVCFWLIEIKIEKLTVKICTIVEKLVSIEHSSKKLCQIWCHNAIFRGKGWVADYWERGCLFQRYMIKFSAFGIHY